MCTTEFAGILKLAVPGVAILSADLCGLFICSYADKLLRATGLSFPVGVYPVLPCQPFALSAGHNASGTSLLGQQQVDHL